TPLTPLSVSDHLQLHLLAAKVEKEIILAGPFCCESLSTLDARQLLRRSFLPATWDQDLLAFRNSFPVIPMEVALRLFRNFLAHVSGAKSLPETLVLEHLASPPKEAEDLSLRPYDVQVEERYALEAQMMAAIREGNATEAIQLWRTLHRKVEFLRVTLGHTQDSYRHSASMTRTIIRLAAMEVGVPPVILDQITRDIRHKNREARTVDEILSNTESLIRSTCAAVRSAREDSPLAQKIKTLLQAHFSEELSVRDLAEYLGLPESRLIERFRKETGITPGEYLRNLRLNHACLLLTSTRLPVQEIASQCGFSDASYFTRLFRSNKGCSPREYRQGGKKKEAADAETT
ncbi:MAG: helix-turn-helix transcriptional regulator, partial [Blautia sp.]|nr:helix-turn-helix transcriptional regulator [Blautia sp.]